VQSKRKHDLGYVLLSDSRMEAAKAYGIAFRLSDEEVETYQGYGIDLEDASGETHHLLPVPSVFLVDAAGQVRWRYSNPDYEVRPDNDELLAAARELAGSRHSSE
jgi:peroxiredoxin